MSRMGPRASGVVGDVKSQKIDAHVPNADLYQLFAYATALDLTGGLVYAQGKR